MSNHGGAAPFAATRGWCLGIAGKRGDGSFYPFLETVRRTRREAVAAYNAEPAADFVRDLREHGIELRECVLLDASQDSGR